MKGAGAGAVIGWLLVSHLAAGQAIDTTYLKSYKDKFFLWPVLKQRTLSFVLEDPDGDKTAEFRPNSSYGLGMGVYLFDLGIEFTFAMPVKEELEYKYGETQSTDLQLNILSRRWGADVFYQRYKGYYLANPNDPVPIGTPYPQRPDIVTENFGVAGVYVFNSHRFSLRSAFTFADRQLKSSGGFLLSGTFNSFDIEGDSAIVGPTYMQLLGLTNAFNSLDYNTFAIAPGYAHNFIIHKNYYVSLLLAIGPAIQDFRYTDMSGVDHRGTKVNSFLDGRIAMGYSNDQFFAGLTISGQIRNVVFEDIRFGSNSSTVRMLLGWRFTEFGFLKRSVWELLPPWGK